MAKILDKRDRAALLRRRLTEAMAQADVSRTALARAAGVDRSTISQLLGDTGARLPNAHLVASCAQALGVSADWLLGLSERPESAKALLATALSMHHAPRAPADDQLQAWHREADGYKIRHVPAQLPDLFKTRAVLEWEYRPHLGRTAEQAAYASQSRLRWMQESRSDYEIAIPLYEIDSFAAGEGYYASLPPDARREQLLTLIGLCREYYPRLRVSLYDARRLWSAPVTVFGPRLAVVYLGQSYLVFRDTERIDAITAQFDHLVREASVTSRALPDYLQQRMDGL